MPLVGRAWATVVRQQHRGFLSNGRWSQTSGCQTRVTKRWP